LQNKKEIETRVFFEFFFALEKIYLQEGWGIFERQISG
jgi:hypothetical protein